MQKESDLQVREIFSIPLLKMKVWEDTDELLECKDYIPSKAQCDRQWYIDNPEEAKIMCAPDRYRILEKFPRTKRILQGYIRSALDRMGYANRFDITTSWLTLNNKGEAVQVHNHKNCYWSAVYYYGHYGGKGSGGEFCLTNPLPDMSSYRPNLKNVNKFTTPLTMVPPQRKDLIIFPSFIQHSVTPHNSDIPRKSLAFNIAPIDNYGDADSQYDTSWF